MSCSRIQTADFTKQTEGDTRSQANPSLAEPSRAAPGKADGPVGAAPGVSLCVKSFGFSWSLKISDDRSGFRADGRVMWSRCLTRWTHNHHQALLTGVSCWGRGYGSCVLPRSWASLIKMPTNVSCVSSIRKTPCKVKCYISVQNIHRVKTVKTVNLTRN